MTFANHDIHIHVPFQLLRGTYLPLMIDRRFNPEISLTGEDLDSLSVAEFKPIADQLQQHRLKCRLHAPFIDLSPGSPDPAVWALTRQRFQQVIDLVHLFEPESVVCHANYEAQRYGFIGDVWLENSVKLWSWLAAELTDRDIRLMLENVYEQGPGELLPLFERLAPHDVEFCFDVGHQNAFSATGIREWLRALGAYLGQLHLHDNHGDQDDHIGLGQGTVELATLFEVLKTRDAAPPLITLEVHTLEGLEASIAYLNTLWPW